MHIDKNGTKTKKITTICNKTNREGVNRIDQIGMCYFICNRRAQHMCTLTNFPSISLFVGHCRCCCLRYSLAEHVLQFAFLSVLLVRIVSSLYFILFLIFFSYFWVCCFSVKFFFSCYVAMSTHCVVYTMYLGS